MDSANKNAFLLDAGFWFALIDENDVHHEQVLQVWKTIGDDVLTPIPVLTEVVYLVKRESGANKLAAFLDIVSETAIKFVAPAAQDYKRSAEIIRQYDDANVDFIDALIVAIAERLLITKILTVDARHFRMFRPAHYRAFEILP